LQEIKKKREKLVVFRKGGGEGNAGNQRGDKETLGQIGKAGEESLLKQEEKRQKKQSLPLKVPGRRRKKDTAQANATRRREPSHKRRPN